MARNNALERIKRRAYGATSDKLSALERIKSRTQGVGGYSYYSIDKWQKDNEDAINVINGYQSKIQNGDWMSSEDRQAYKSAIDKYTTSATNLRDLNRKLGTSYTADEEKSWNDSLSSLGSSYDEIEKHYSQWRDEDDYRGIEHWFEKPSQFDDGWQFGDGFKAVAGTLSDLKTHLGAGMLGIGEGLVDALATLGPYLAQGQYYANGGGYNIQADQAFNDAIATQKAGSAEFVKKDLYDEDAIARRLPDALEPITGINIDQHSVLGGKADSVVKSSGQMLGTIALQGVGVPWWLTTGATSLGSEAENALRQGANLEEAAFSGLVSAGAEILTEKLFGGMKFVGGQTVDDALLKPLINSISNKTLRTIVSKGVDIAGEGLEEVFSGMLGAVGQKLSYASEQEWKNLFSSEDALDALIGGVAMSLGLGGASAKVSDAIVNTRQGAEMQKAFGKGVGADITAQTLELNGDNKYAQKLNSKLEGGKNLSAYQTGKILGEYKSEVNGYDIGKVKAAAESRLTELGETGDVSAIADAIARETVGEELSFKDRAVLNKSTNANIVLTEMMPENIKGGNLANKWAEGIGTKRVNADVYNLREATDTPKAKGSTETKIGAPAGDVKAAIEQAAKDKVGKIEGFTEETANVMVKDYDGSVSPSEYVTTFEEAFKLGRDNAQVKELTRLSKDSGVIGRALLHAYDAGLQSRNVASKATNPENSVLQNGTESAIINTESESITNEGKTGTESIPLRRGGERINGAYSEGQISRVEGGTGQNQEWRENRSRPAESEAARLLDEGRGREVRVADLGILNGSKQQKVRVIDNEADYTPSMKRTAANAKKQGLNVNFFVGDNILIEEKNGSITGVNGYVLGNQVLVRADHNRFTSEQIFGHEAAHDRLAKAGAEQKSRIIAEAKQKLANVGDNVAYEALAEFYEDAYSDSNLTDEEIWEEIVCDIEGGMNWFDDERGELMQLAIQDVKGIVESATVKTTEGVTEGKASRDLYTATNEFVRDVSFSDRSAFARSLANKTSGMVEGEVRTIYIYSTAKVYAFRADGYMHGEMVESFSLSEYKKLIDARKEFIHDINSDGKTSDLWLTPISDIGTESGSSISISERGRRSASDDILSENTSRSNRTRDTEREWKNPRTEEENREIVNQLRISLGLKPVDYSTQGKFSRELDSLGNELSPAIQKRFANSKVVDENGRLKVVYHGTPAGEFFTFDKSKGSVEGDFGSGFYFTDNEADVSANYEGGGPDFENKVWRRAEQIFDEDPDIQMDEAREKARAEMFKGSHKFEVYLNVENPAIVGETILFDPDSYAENYNEDDYDSYDDYIGDVEQLLVDDVDSIIWDIERNVDLYSNTDQIRNVLYDAYYEGGIDVQNLKDKINELYLESNDGEMVANEVARQIIESLGYDGIIDSTVSSKFKNMGMEDGTTHYIVFKPNQIKSITNQNPTDNPDIRYSRELDLIDYINEKAKVERANMTKAQLVAEVRSELEAMNVGKGELMAVQKVADKLFERYGGNASISEFRYAMLEATRLALKEEGFDAAYEVINEVAKEVAYNPKDLGGEAELLSQIQKDIRATKLSVHEKDKTSGEFDNYGGYGAFRKRLFGKVNLVNDGQQVDAKYEELQNVYGKSFFPDVNTVSEQLMVIEEVMNTPLSDYMMVDETELSETADEMTMSLFTRLGDIWTKANEGVNVAVNKQKAGSPRELLANALENVTQNAAEKENLKKYKKEIDGLNEQERKLWDLKRQMWEKSFQNGTKDKAELRKLKDEITKTENRINLYDRRLLNLEATKALHDLVVREKKAAYKAAAEKGREALHRNVEGRHKSEARAKIKKLKQKFQSIIEHPTDRQYIPVDLMSAMIDVCDLIDTSSSLYKTDGSINKAQQARNEQAQRLLKLKAEYDKLAKSADYAIAYEYEQEIADYIQTIMTDYANKNISDMTLEQLTDLYQMMRSIEETLRDARRLIGWSDAMTVYEAGDSIIEEQAKIGEKRKQNGISKVDDSIVNMSLSPVRAVLRMAGYNEDSALYHSIREIENGTRQQKKFVMDAVKKFEGLTTGKNASTYEKAIYDPYGKELIDKNGQKFHVTKMQMMQAIMSYEREMANEKLHHVSNGGFTFADVKLLGKGEIREAVSAKYAHTITLGSDVAVKFMSELANDKWAQEYMSEARNFFDVTGKEAINEANMKLKHRIVATGKNYIPYEVNSDFIVREINSENDIQQVISGYGMLKDLKEGASQPLSITGLNNVLDRHIEQVGNVAALAVPIRNFNKIWNVKSTDGSTTVREKIKSNWGVGGEDLITQAVKDVQGSRHQDKSPIYKLYKKVKGNIIQGVFLGNWSVVFKQIGSMFTSTSMLDYRDPVSMMANLIATKVNRDAIAAEVNKYTAVAWVRGQGLSDAELYELKTTAKRSKLGRAVDKLPPALNAAKWITQMDYDVALSLWKYAKEDTAKRTGLKGEELLKATADYYNDVIENTQSMSDALHRPEVQKSDNVASELVGIFKTDLYQSAGLLRVAFESKMAKPSKETNRALVKAVCGTLSSMCWESLITSVMAAFRYKVDRYRDEEDDEITLENWIKVAGGDMLEEMFGYMIPLFGGEAAGLLKAWITGETYEFDNLTLEAINGLSKAMTSAGKLISEGEDEPEKILRVLKTLLVKGTSVFGVPANNVTRFFDAMRLHAQDIANGEFMSFEAGLTSPNNTRLYRAYIEGDADKINKASRLYKDEAALKAGLRKGLRENDPRLREAAIAKLNGDNATYKRLCNEVLAEGKFDRTIIIDAFAAEYNYQKNKADEEGK